LSVDPDAFNSTTKVLAAVSPNYDKFLPSYMASHSRKMEPYIAPTLIKTHKTLWIFPEILSYQQKYR
jgi:hypothetical protein